MRELELDQNHFGLYVVLGIEPKASSLPSIVRLELQPGGGTVDKALDSQGMRPGVRFLASHVPVSILFLSLPTNQSANQSF